MPPLAPSEQHMWDDVRPESDRVLSDDGINAKYGKRELRIVTESNREQLPNFVEALKRPIWMELRPFCQRRQRWGEERQSKLIESFIMNTRSFRSNCMVRRERRIHPLPPPYRTKPHCGRRGPATPSENPSKTPHKPE